MNAFHCISLEFVDLIYEIKPLYLEKKEKKKKKFHSL